MNYSYYPGCTLKTKAKELDRYARSSAEKLGLHLEELEDWQCCGAVYPQAEDEIATKLSAVRALAQAKEKGGKLVTLCSACHHVIKRVNLDMQNNEYIRTRVNNYIAPDAPYAGETQVLHYLELLRDELGFEQLKKSVVNPLKGRKIAAYYGCMLLRPAEEMGMDDPENPKILEDFLRALGAEPRALPLPKRVLRRLYRPGGQGPGQTKRGQDPAFGQPGRGGGGHTACPLCLYNLPKTPGRNACPCSTSPSFWPKPSG